MTRVRVDLNISLDGYTSAGQSSENPMGEDWGPLMASYTATRTMQQQVFGDTTGAGTTGIDDSYAAAHFEGVGAEIMGAGKFGLHAFPDDPDWKGWWGDEPPFHTPVFVLTHHDRGSVVVREHEHRCVERRIRPPPAAPLRVVLPAWRAELARAHDLRTDPGSVPLGHRVVDTLGAARLAEDFAASEPRGEHPLVEPLPGVAERLVEGQPLSGGEPVE